VVAQIVAVFSFRDLRLAFELLRVVARYRADALVVAPRDDKLPVRE
jgi:hypothetical protein